MNRSANQIEMADGRRRSAALVCCLGVCVGGCMSAIIGCQAERVEYHRRPSYYEQYSATPLQNEVVLDDGTVVRYVGPKQPPLPSAEQGKQFQMREEDEEGNITLHALLPEHVLINLLNCLRNEEYEPLWAQLISERTKVELQKTNEGEKELTAYFQKNRHDLAALLNRMVAGLPAQEVSFTPLGNGITRCRLRPQVAGVFKFKYVDVICERTADVNEIAKSGGLLLNEWKLLTIR